MSRSQPVVLCHTDDAQALNDLVGTARLVMVAAQNEKLAFRPTEAGAGTISEPGEAAQIYRDTIGFMAVSETGVAFHPRLATLWSACFGAAAEVPSLVDLSAPDAPAPLAAVTGMCWQTLSELHVRNARLMRELGVVREAHEATQASFRRLESFFYETNNSARVLHMALDVQRKQHPLALSAKKEIEQVLPTDSSGLCDVAVQVSAAPGADGVLWAQLALKESGIIAAEWEVPAAAIRKGWLRLTLEQALGPDRQTPVLRLSWKGDTPLALGTSFHHPDSRFAPMAGARMLALHLWKYIPGARAPLPGTGIMATTSGRVDRWRIGRSLLRDAIAVSAVPDNVAYSDQFAGLLVMPTGEAPGIARLDAVVRAGVRHLSGGIKTEDKAGPTVEYAYGLAPVRRGRSNVPGTPESKPQIVSEWCALSPNVWSELHLPLEQPLSEDHDLFLMTRLPSGESVTEPPKACFFPITARAEAEPDA